MDRTTYMVTHLDEGRSSPHGPSSHIPTLGAATTAIDQYRTIGIHETNLNDLSVALTDIESVLAISKIAEGGIINYQELQAAETALQALLLHDFVHVIIPAPKVQFDNGLITYVRTDINLRSDFSYELFGLTQSRDWLVAPEYAKIEANTFTSTSLNESPIKGRSVEDLTQRKFEYSSKSIADAMNAVIQEHSIPAYLANSSMSRPRRGDGFPKRFYHNMRISWDKATEGMPPIVCTFTLPPLLAIVLDRLNNRADLLSIVLNLREELKGVRAELHEFNKILTDSVSQGEIESRIKRIDESFSVIIPESRLTDSQRMRRRLGVIYRLSRPILRFMAAHMSGAGTSISDMTKLAHGDISKIMESRSIVDRTTTSSKFAELLRTESLQSLVKIHFSNAEIAAIENSLTDHS